MQDSKATPHRAHSLISLNLILEYSYILNTKVITLSEAKVLLFYFLNRLQVKARYTTVDQ